MLWPICSESSLAQICPSKLFRIYGSHFKSRVVRKPVFMVSDQVQPKSGCIAIEDGQRLEILDLGSRAIVLIAVKSNTLLSWTFVFAYVPVGQPLQTLTRLLLKEQSQVRVLNIFYSVCTFWTNFSYDLTLRLIKANIMGIQKLGIFQ